jgi:hypothetical protein
MAGRIGAYYVLIFKFLALTDPHSHAGRESV